MFEDDLLYDPYPLQKKERDKLMVLQKIT